MLLLAADTSGKQGSIALVRGHDDGSCEIVEVVPLAGGTFSAQLVPQIAALLAKHRFTKNEIGAFAVASGPGSFTGLRVGLAAIKGLAEVLNKPIAAVSLLEAIAVSHSKQGRVVAALDAGRGELYVGEYEFSPTSARLISEKLVPIAEFLEQPSNGTLLTPDATLVEAAARTGLQVTLIEPLSAASVARLGWHKIQSSQTVAPEHLEANYIRRSDAEIFAKNP